MPVCKGLRGANSTDSSVPTMGWMPALARVSVISKTPNRLLTSVTATAGLPASRARSASSLGRTAPSSSE